MSEKTAKAARKEAAESDGSYDITIKVMKDGGFEMEVPKGAPIPLTMDVLMRCQRQVWDTFMRVLQAQAAAKRMVQPVGGMPEGLLRRSP